MVTGHLPPNICLSDENHRGYLPYLVLKIRTSYGYCLDGCCLGILLELLGLGIGLLELGLQLRVWG